MACWPPPPGAGSPAAQPTDSGNGSASFLKPHLPFFAHVNTGISRWLRPSITVDHQGNRISPRWPKFPEKLSRIPWIRAFSTWASASTTFADQPAPPSLPCAGHHLTGIGDLDDQHQPPAEGAH